MQRLIFFIALGLLFSMTGVSAFADGCNCSSGTHCQFGAIADPDRPGWLKAGYYCADNPRSEPSQTYRGHYKQPETQEEVIETPIELGAGDEAFSTALIRTNRGWALSTTNGDACTDDSDSVTALKELVRAGLNKDNECYDPRLRDYYDGKVAGALFKLKPGYTLKQVVHPDHNDPENSTLAFVVVKRVASKPQVGSNNGCVPKGDMNDPSNGVNRKTYLDCLQKINGPVASGDSTAQVGK
jgi:hypothetical protein